MAWTDVDHVRLISGLTVSDISNADLDLLILEAQQIVRADINSKVYEEKLTGTIDGSNTVFFTKFAPIADRNFDMVVDANDVSVWLVKVNDITGEKEYTQATVSAVRARSGAIELASPPDPNNVDYVVADYDYVIGNLDWNLVKLATSLMTAHLAMLNLEGLLPSSEYTYKIGKRSVKRKGVDLAKTDNVDKFYFKYKQVINQIRATIVYNHHLGD